MNTRFLRLALLSALLALTLSAAVLAVSFPDTDGHWAEPAIDYWTERGVISGYPDGDFRPDQNITRAEAAKVLAQVLGISGGDMPYFSDVSPNYWGYPAIQACAEYGLMQGSMGQFRPGSDITRQEAMTVLFRAATYPVGSVQTALNTAQDGNQVSAWARDAVGTLMWEDVVQGLPDGNIQPQAPISRAEFATLMYRIARDNRWKRLDALATSASPLVWDAGGVTVRAQTVRGETYLFLPAAADLTALALDLEQSGLESAQVTLQGDRASTTDAVFDLTALSTKEADGSYALTVTADTEGAEYPLRVVQSSGIPAMFLTSADPEAHGRSYVDAAKGNSVKGSMVMLGPDGSIIYDNPLSQIKSRGNATFYYPKKPYQIKLDKKSDLLGNGEKVKTWVLLSNYADPTMFRDKLCKDLAARMNLPGTPDCQWVDLYFDGEYRGCYLLSEKVQISSTGLDITDLEGMYEDLNPDYGDDVVIAESQNRFGEPLYYVEGLTDPEDISNGYLLEFNSSAGDENCWFRTTRGRALNVKSPENLTDAAMQYISEFYQEFEDAVYAVDADGTPTGVNPETDKTYTEYCDLDSLARMYLLYLFSDNQDAYAQSTFFYMEDGILHAGPMWDGDQTFGIGWVEDAPPDQELRFSYLVNALTALPDFQAAIQRLYETEIRALFLSCETEIIPGYVARLSGSERVNHVLWPVYQRTASLSDTYSSLTKYSEICTMTTQWMQARIAYIDAVVEQWSIPETPPES